MPEGPSTTTTTAHSCRTRDVSPQVWVVEESLRRRSHVRKASLRETGMSSWDLVP